MIKHTILWSAILLLLIAGSARADSASRCEVHTEADPMLCTYEPNTIGYTLDSDDVAFMDFKLSLRYQLFPASITRAQNDLHEGLGNESAIYFAFTGRFGQYIGTRESAPVVAKRFNPKLFYRYWTDNEHDSYVDFAFLAHESNGQSIDSAAEYQAALATTKDQNAVNDQISRGWDYLELVWKSKPLEIKDTRTMFGFLTFKYFLPYGPLEGRAEEYNSWENSPQGKPRSHVNGIAGMIKFVEKGSWLVFRDMKAAALYETGYREPFRFSTYRLELSTKSFQMPVTIWWQTGYNSDLAQYYKKVYSRGIEVEIGSF